MIEKVIEDFVECSEVEAIALGGSRGSGRGDEYSDYDIYVYLTGDLNREKRRAILERYCSYMEIGNEFWEEEDDCILNNGIDMELIYRKIENIEGNLRYVVDSCGSSMGYTTCFWENVVNSKILYDRRGRLTELAERYRVEYPEELKKNIIEKNHKLLKDYMPSLYYQIEKAIKRNDMVAINHRLTEFLALYFDIIYALNGEKHRGEKRMLEITREFDLLPENYVGLMEDLFKFIYTDNPKFLTTLDKICHNLYNLLKKEGYRVTFESYRK